MGDKTRCISEAVLYNDNFIDLPSSAKALYIYINMKTDDKGMCDEVKSIMRALGSKPKDLQLLIERGYILEVRPWLFLETHFNINNRNLRKDRLKDSRFEKHLENYELEDGMWVLRTIDNQLPTIDNQLTPQHNITKHNITKLNQTEDKEYIDLTHLDNAEDFKSFLRGK